MASRLTKLHSRLTMASLPSTTLRQSSFPSQKIFLSCNRPSNCRRTHFSATASNPRIFSSNPRIFLPCLKPSHLPSPVNRSRISQNRLVILASSQDHPKREIDPNPSYPIPGDPPYPIPGDPDEPPGTPEKPPLPSESPESLPLEVPAKPEIPPSPDPSWPSEVPYVDPSLRPEIKPPKPGTSNPIIPPPEVPLRSTGIRDPPLYPPGSPPPDIVPPIPSPPGVPPDIPPYVPPIPPPDVPPVPSPDWPPFPCPPPPDPFPPIPTPPIMRDWPLQLPWISILSIFGFK